MFWYELFKEGISCPRFPESCLSYCSPICNKKGAWKYFPIFGLVQPGLKPLDKDIHGFLELYSWSDDKFEITNFSLLSNSSGKSVSSTIELKRLSRPTTV